MSIIFGLLGAVVVIGIVILLFLRLVAALFGIDPNGTDE